MIVGALPATIKNGDAEDANVVMSLFQFIQSQINANGCPATSGTGVLKGDGAGGTTAAVVGVDILNPNSATSFRNRLRNGNFAINQPGVTGTVTLAANAHAHDGWKAGAGGCTYTFAVSGMDTVITITAGSLLQIVEANQVEGGVYVASNKGTAQARIAVNGAATSGAYAALPLQSAAATANQQMVLEFTTGTIDRAQLEPGQYASAFERRTPAVEMAICQRYYETGTFKNYSYSSAGAIVGGQVTYKVTKRVAPAVSLTNAFTSNVSATPTLDSNAVDGFSVYHSVTAQGATNFTDTWTADARL